jgi:hypothetical protein
MAITALRLMLPVPCEWLWTCITPSERLGDQLTDYPVHALDTPINVSMIPLFFFYLLIFAKTV